MPQKMNVVCCCTCQMYQVEIVKKAKKWQCKVCGEKQSLQKVFYEGTGKDCRLAVQNLNFSKSNEPLKPDLNSYDHRSDTDEEFFDKSGPIYTSEVLETDPTNDSTFGSARFSYSPQSEREIFSTLKQPTFDQNNDHTNTSQLEESLEYELIEEDFKNDELHMQSHSMNSNEDREVEGPEEEKENTSSNSNNSGKRRSDESDDFSKPSKRAKKEFSFVDLIEESDSDTPAETESAATEPKCSIFESNCEIDFSLDF